MFRLLYADPGGRLYEDPELLAVGRSGGEFWELDESEMIPLPPGADLMLLPLRAPVGVNPRDGQPEILECLEDGTPVYAVAAVLPAGYTRLLLPGYENIQKDGQELPLFGYTAVGVDQEGQVWVAARLTDRPDKWNPLSYNDDSLPERISRKKEEFPGNRILEQLAHCSLDYHCLTAQNIFYERWEAGLPVSPVCNARCIGCISLQPSECCPSPQARINFTPTVDELAELGAAHLIKAPDAIISGGQGCEGEALKAHFIWSPAIRKIRQKTNRGTININTNAGYTRGLAELCEAGLDSIRVSLFSAREELYHAYHRPVDYTLADVRNSIRLAKEYGLFVSLNLLAFPGVTDRPEEAAALTELINEYKVDMVQLRNLNIDPDSLLKAVGPPGGEILGMTEFISLLVHDCPHLIVGSYSHPVHKA